MDEKKFQEITGHLVNRAFKDAEFKKRLIDDPIGVCKENGIPIPEGVEIKVHANTDNLLHIVLPSEPVTRDVRGLKTSIWEGEAFYDLFNMLFRDGAHVKTWEDQQEEDKKIY